MSDGAGLYTVEMTDGKTYTVHARQMVSDEDSMTLWTDGEGDPIHCYMLHSVRRVVIYEDEERADNEYSVKLDPE